MSAPSYVPLDDALDRLAGYSPTLANGNFNHAPMVAETLCALGRPDAVLPWLERYRSRMLARRPVDAPVDREQWRVALGERERFADWAEFFDKELDRMPWHEVLDLWAGRLAPGLAAAATHGVIRTGHAVRSLGASETRPRRRELADALASWAASYLELPAADDPTDASPTPRDAIGRIAIMPPEQRPGGNITAALAALGDMPEFAQTIGFIKLEGDAAALLPQLTELFTRVYLANVSNTLTAIVFIHGVTSLTALGNIVGHVSDRTARSLLRYGWQAGCGLYACYGGAGIFGDLAPGDADIEALTEQAIDHGDEHVIKFTEACLNRSRLAPSLVYPAAITHVLGAIPRR